MSSNGHADASSASPRGSNLLTDSAAIAPVKRAEEIRRIICALEVPFEPSIVEWRVTNTSQDRTRGQVIPYADQRAYTDRLNTLFTPAGWTRRYSIHTTANFERSKGHKIVAKVLVTCELTIFGLGLHSATGEQWADNDNAGTAAEAQAFKRASSCFGLGRYFYYFEGVWVDLDERNRPRSIPQLPGWATPAGWEKGLRPNGSSISNGTTNGGAACAAGSQQNSIVAEIEGMAEQLGRGLYRGLLRDLARAWSPREIQDLSLQQRVLEHMRSAERGLKRLEAALDKVGPEALIPILKANQLTSIERIDNLEILKRIVLELERTAETSF